MKMAGISAPEQFVQCLVQVTQLPSSTVYANDDFQGTILQVMRFPLITAIGNHKQQAVSSFLMAMA